MGERVYIAKQGQLLRCSRCRETKELRFGFCFECANAGEIVAAKRTVIGHLKQSAVQLRCGRFFNARCAAKWAWERITRTGDYAPGGYFERQGIAWWLP